jgi:hypothetical protein
MADATEPASDWGSLAPGTDVEVRTAFEREWARGFQVEERTDDGYRLRRRSDGALLPVVFPFDDVRRPRKGSMWWF